MFKSIDIMCDTCQEIYTILVSVPAGGPLPDTAPCEECGAEAKRKISFNIAKVQIEERTHGGRLTNGRVVSRELGSGRAKEWSKLNREMKDKRKNGKHSEAAEVAKELHGKKEEWKKSPPKT